MAMSKTLKYVLIGGGVAVGVYFVARKFGGDEPSKPSVVGSATQIVDGVKDLFGSVKNSPLFSATPTADTPTPKIPVRSADGDSAIANSSGLDRATQFAVMPTTPTYKARAATGEINGSFYTLPPARTRA